MPHIGSRSRGDLLMNLVIKAPKNRAPKRRSYWKSWRKSNKIRLRGAILPFNLILMCFVLGWQW